MLTNVYGDGNLLPSRLTLTVIVELDNHLHDDNHHD